MAVQLSYDRITKYLVTAVCTEPLHIGSSSGEKEDVLVHPVEHMPFIQASGLAGVLRHCCREIHPEAEEALFGANKIKADVSEESRIKITDGKFKSEHLKLELRPRLRIDPESGTSSFSQIKGTEKKAGSKFNIKYIGAGAEFSFCVYLYGEKYLQELEDIFSLIQKEAVQFGGQKSNGCGYIKLQGLKRIEFDMKKKEDRKKWVKEDSLSESEYQNRIGKLTKNKSVRECYEITVEGRTEGELQVKSLVVTEYGKNAPKSVNMQNANKDYIVPASSWKGAVRGQMEKIAAYLDCMDIIEDTFGMSAETGMAGKTGNIQFFDTVVGDRRTNDLAELSHRIHIDKFTGGVMHGGLFSEKNVSGKVNFRIIVKNKNHPERSCGLLFMALRDLAIGNMSIGSGYNIGKGILDVDKICIQDNIHGGKAAIDFKQQQIKGDTQIIDRCMEAISHR